MQQMKSMQDQVTPLLSLNNHNQVKRGAREEVEEEGEEEEEVEVVEVDAEAKVETIVRHLKEGLPPSLHNYPHLLTLLTWSMINHITGASPICQKLFQTETLLHTGLLDFFFLRR